MIEVLKQALDAMKAAKELADKYGDEELFYGFDYVLKNINEAMKALESQEPVGALTLGGIIDTSDGLEYEGWDVEWDTKAIEALQEKLVTSDSVEVMLYTHPPQRTEPMSWEDTVLHQKKLLDEMEALLTKTSAPRRTWVGLTDEWIESAGARWVRDGYNLYAFAKTVEAKLKEKNNG